jgi:hypothetical protein
MNDDSSTFELPEYIHSRLQPSITLEFPDEDEELAILRQNLPYSSEDVLRYVVGFLQAAHTSGEVWSVRDGINVARYAGRLGRLGKIERLRALEHAIEAIVGRDAIGLAPGEI